MPAVDTCPRWSSGRTARVDTDTPAAMITGTLITDTHQRSTSPHRRQRGVSLLTAGAVRSLAKDTPLIAQLSKAVTDSNGWVLHRQTPLTLERDDWTGFHNGTAQRARASSRHGPQTRCRTRSAGHVSMAHRHPWPHKQLTAHSRSRATGCTSSWWAHQAMQPSTCPQQHMHNNTATCPQTHNIIATSTTHSDTMHTAMEIAFIVEKITPRGVH